MQKLNRALLIALLLNILSSTASSLAQVQKSPPFPTSRSRSEELIRETVYKMMVATIGGDAQTAKELSAQRMVKFYDLVYAELMTSAGVKRQLSQAGITSGTALLEWTFKQAASKTTGVLQSEVEKEARRRASLATISFLNDTEAKVQFEQYVNRLLLEDGIWRIDGTEGARSLALEKLPLSVEGKARIKNF